MHMSLHDKKPVFRRSFGFVAAVSFLFLFLLTACGTNSSGGTGSPAPSNTPTTVSGYGTAYGCPSNAVVASTSTTANVIVKLSQTNVPITAHTGDVIEIQLPFGHKWSGPTTSQGQLELQTPSGYAAKANSVCVWRFVAKGAGTTALNFTGQALCKPGELCPQYIMDVPFTIDVK
jgi:hypothetical protein